jgi:hypothetical protein
MSIIGARRLIPHFKHKRDRNPKVRDPKVSKQYDQRNRLLKKLGYTSYSEYLASDEWKVIRTRVLASGPQCVMCDRPSVVVHHVKYWDTVLLGLQDSCLAPLCHGCHERIEVVDGVKARMGAANCALVDAASKVVHGQKWLENYRKNLSRKRGRKGRTH